MSPDATTYDEDMRQWIQARRVRNKRRSLALTYIQPRLAAIDRWLDDSAEITNFTYPLTQSNLAHLAAFVSIITGTHIDTVESWQEELLTDELLASHIASLSHRRPGADPHAHFGRRIGWYAFVRALKPSLVVEAGVDKGLGACVLAAALLRNAADGNPGSYIGIDRNEQAGWLLSGRYADVGTMVYRDSLEALAIINEPIDVFIHDSDHSSAHEQSEYSVLEDKLAPNGIVVSDNAHATDELLDFARRTGRNFLFFREEPDGHWYPGAGIGVAWYS